MGVDKPDAVAVEVVQLRSEEIDAQTRASLRKLLWAAFDGFTEDDWAHGFGGIHVVVLDGARAVGHAAVVPRRIHFRGGVIDGGYVEGVAVDANHRGAGIGTAIMREVSQIVSDVYPLCLLSTHAHEFYERIGWERWRGPSFVVAAGQWRRTVEEDGGIMLLRRPDGLALRVDLQSEVAVDERAGDDW